MNLRPILQHIKRLSRDELSFVANMTGGLAVALLMAAFVASGGMYKVNRVLVAYNILPANLTGCVFPCNNTGYAMEALIPESSQGVVASTFLLGQQIRFQWNAGAYGANNFSHACMGATYGASYVCNVSLGSPNYTFNSCVPVGTCTGTWQCTGYDKYGSCISQVCTGTITTSPSNCGNADDYWGATCFSSSGGTVPSCPGYDGNWNDPAAYSSFFNAPGTAGTYTYYFCSNALLHGAYNPNISALPCLGVNVNVIDCATSGFSSPWNTTSYLILAGGKGTVNNWYGRFCVKNLSSNAIYLPMATQTEWNNFVSAAPGISASVTAY